MSAWGSMWGLHSTVLGDTGAFSPAPALVGRGEREGYVPARRTHTGLGRWVNGPTFSLQRRDRGLCVTHTCCRAVCKQRECTALNVSVGLEPGELVLEWYLESCVTTILSESCGVIHLLHCRYWSWKYCSLIVSYVLFMKLVLVLTGFKACSSFFPWDSWHLCE